MAHVRAGLLIFGVAGALGCDSEVIERPRGPGAGSTSATGSAASAGSSSSSSGSGGAGGDPGPCAPEPWTTTTIDGDDTGWVSSIVVDAIGGVHIAYADGA
jgi:hypothetical protein